MTQVTKNELDHEILQADRSIHKAEYNACATKISCNIAKLKVLLRKLEIIAPPIKDKCDISELNYLHAEIKLTLEGVVESRKQLDNHYNSLCEIEQELDSIRN